MRQKAHFQRDNTHKTVTDIRLCSLIRCCPLVGQSEYLLQCQICAAPVVSLLVYAFFASRIRGHYVQT